MIKLLALSLMLFGHVCQVYFPAIEKFNILGRLSFPLFTYGISQDYKLTRNYKLYTLRLLMLAVISQILYYLLFRSDYFNVYFTLLTGLLVLRVYEAKYSNLTKFAIISALSSFSYIMNFEYGVYGIATIVIFHVFRNNYTIFFLQYNSYHF